MDSEIDDESAPRSRRAPAVPGRGWRDLTAPDLRLLDSVRTQPASSSLG